MFDKVKEAFNNYPFLSPKDLFHLVTLAKLSNVRKGELLVKEGDRCYFVFIVLNGLLRHYVIDQSGEEKTLRFVPERWHTASMETIFNDNPAAENIVAIENSTILKFDSRALDDLSRNNIRLLRIQNHALRETVSRDVEQIKFLSRLSPEE